MDFVKGEQTESEDWEIPIELYAYPRLLFFPEEVIIPYILGYCKRH